MRQNVKTSFLVVHNQECAPRVVDPEEIVGFCWDGELTYLRLSDGTGLAILERPSALVRLIREAE